MPEVSPDMGMTQTKNDRLVPEATPPIPAGAESGYPMGGDGPAESPGGHEPELADIERRPLREILTVALPSVVTMTSYTVMQFIDTLMVSRIGADEVYVAAAGNGAITAWLAIAFMLGLTGVVSTFVSQHLGAGTPREGAGYLWTSLWMCVGWWGLICLPALVLCPWIFGLMNHDARLVELELGYARVALGGALFTLAGRTIAQYFFGIHRPSVVMIAAISGNVVNAIANAVLIFGPEAPGLLGPLGELTAACARALSIPAMGVIGAALGTVIGGVVEFAIPVGVALWPGFHRRFGTRSAFAPSAKKMLGLVKLGWPAGMMFVNELLCWSYLMVVLVPLGGRARALAEGGSAAVVEQAGLVANTAGWIALRYMHVSFMPTVGLSMAMAAVIGKCMGAGRPDLAAKRGWLGLWLALGYMAVCAVVFLVFREPLIAVFAPDGDENPEIRAAVIQAGAGVMIAAAVFQLFDATAITLSGVLRGAGDTVWPGVATMILSWVCIVGGGHLLVWLAPGLGQIGPWIGASAYIILLGGALLWRFSAGGWKSIRVIEHAAGDAATPS